MTDYSQFTVEIKNRMTRLDRSLPLKDWKASQEEAAKVLLAAKNLHDWIVEQMT